jgi:hypothetical protein
VIIAIALAVAAAHLFTGPSYRGPFRPFVTGYLIDLLLPFSSYFLLVAATDSFRFLSPWHRKVAIVVAIMSCAEAAQYFGKPIFGSTYDPLDLIAYAVGAMLAAAADRLLLPRLFPFWRQDHDAPCARPA